MSEGKVLGPYRKMSLALRWEKGLQRKLERTPDSMIRQAMRLCLWAQAALLGSLGLYVLASLVASSGTDEWSNLLGFSTALLWPAVLYLLTLSRFLRDETQRHGLAKPAGAVPRAFLLVLSVFLYLPLMILMSSDTSGWKAWPLAHISLFAVLWLFCTCAYRWLRCAGSAAPPENIRPRRDLRHWLETSSRILRAPVVLLLGAVLLVCSVWLLKTEVISVLNGDETWITAELGLGAQIPAAKVLLGYLGRLVYGGSLLLAACTVVLLLVCRFSSAALRTSRIAAVIGPVAGFLAICSITDYYFSWLSFILDGRLPVADWILFVLFFLHWLVPLLFVAAVLRARRHREESVGQELRIVVVFYTPLFLFDLAMTPFFPDNLDNLFILVAFLGLQFLAWGYLELAGSGFPKPQVG